MEDGNKYYRVSYDGVLTKLVIDGIVKEGFQKGEPIVRIHYLRVIRGDELIKKDSKKYSGTSYYNPKKYLDNVEYFSNYEKAIKKSKENFDKIINPKGIYKVARYFDDIFEIYVTGELTKKEAKTKENELNKGPRAYVSYKISDVTKNTSHNNLF